MIPTSTIYRIARYLHDVCDASFFTARELHDNAVDAQIHYLGEMPLHVADDIEKCLERHGYGPNDDGDHDDDNWLRVLDASSHWTFIPTDREASCNREIKRIMHPHPHINSIPELINYTTQLIKQAIDRNVLQYHDRTHRPFTYHINPDYLED